MKLFKDLQKEYDSYCNKNEKKIVDEFVREIRKWKVSDLTLAEFSRFLFWKSYQSIYLKKLYKDFKVEVDNTDLDYNAFCKATWIYIDKVSGDKDVDFDKARDVLLGLKDGIEGEA